MALTIGLTGGIGSGKSTVAAILQEAGATVIDADAISRQSTAAQGTAMPAILTAFGPDFLDTHGAMNRDAMRQRVFSDPKARLQLQAIVHPIVAAEIAKQSHQALAAGCRLLVLEIPLLVESAHWRSALSRILVVDCELATQVQRVMVRSGWTESAVHQAIAAQASRAQRLAAADAVVFNEGLNLAQLRAHVLSIGRAFGL